MGKICVWSPQFPDGLIQFHDVSFGIVDLPLHMGTKVEVLVEVDAEELGLGLLLKLNSIQDKLGRVMHHEPTTMEQYV